MSRTIRNDIYVHWRGYMILKNEDGTFDCPRCELFNFKTLPAIKKAIVRTQKLKP